jgi:hypothetical protein
MSRVLWDVYLTLSTPDAFAVDVPRTVRRDDLPAAEIPTTLLLDWPSTGRSDAAAAPGIVDLTLSYDSHIVSYDRL